MSKSTRSLLHQLIAIPSVFPQEQKLANFLEYYLQDLSFHVERISSARGRDNIVATFGQAETYLCFYGHMDTVPPDPLWKERQDPFSVTLDGDVARGLGAADMKGGIVAILQTARFAHHNNLPLKVAFGVDEENISLGSHTLSQHTFFGDVRCMISAESGQIINEHQDFAVNYGRKGRIVLELHIEGKTAHAAQSYLAVNAIQQAAQVIQILQSAEFPIHPQLGPAELVPFYIHSTTDAFSIPERATIYVNVLTVPGVSSDDVMNFIHHQCQAHNIHIDVQVQERETPYMESYQVDRQDEFIRLLETKIFPRYSVIPGYAQSVADENRFANTLNIPVISMGPIGGGDHTADEWVSLKSLEKTILAYSEIVRDFATL